MGPRCVRVTLTVVVLCGRVAADEAGNEVVNAYAV